MELVKIFGFSEKIPDFSKTVQLCLNFYIVLLVILFYLISIIESQKIVHETQFYINCASALNSFMTEVPIV